MGRREYFIYDRSGRLKNPLEAMPNLPIAKQPSDVGIDEICNTTVLQDVHVDKTVYFQKYVRDVDISISKGTKGIVIMDEFGLHLSSFVDRKHKKDIRIVDLTDIGCRFDYTSIFHDDETADVSVEESEQPRYVAGEKFSKRHCPLKNGDYKILEDKAVTDINGAILGVVIAKSPHQYATWEYTYYPRSDLDIFFGFNNGHYFSDEAKAIFDFDKRCDARLYELAQRNMNENLTQEDNSAEDEIDDTEEDEYEPEM